MTVMQYSSILNYINTARHNSLDYLNSVFSRRVWQAVLYRELPTSEHIMVVWTKELSPRHGFSWHIPVLSLS